MYYPKNLNDAAARLQFIREARHDQGADNASLAARVDEIGRWVAAQKIGKLQRALLHEAHQLHDVLSGGSGKSGVRLDIQSI